MKNMMRLVLKRGFGWLGLNLIETVKRQGSSRCEKLWYQNLNESQLEMD